MSADGGLAVGQLRAKRADAEVVPDIARVTAVREVRIGDSRRVDHVRIRFRRRAAAACDGDERRYDESSDQHATLGRRNIPHEVVEING